MNFIAISQFDLCFNLFIFIVLGTFACVRIESPNFVIDIKTELLLMFELHANCNNTLKISVHSNVKV